MSNYNSTHTGAELDEAIGRVIDGGSIKVQVDTNTTDIADLKGRMTTVEGNTIKATEEVLTVLRPTQSVPSVYIYYLTGAYNSTSNTWNLKEYAVEGGKTYAVTGKTGTGPTGCLCAWYNGETFIRSEYPTNIASNRGIVFDKQQLTAPANATKLSIVNGGDTNATIEAYVVGTRNNEEEIAKIPTIEAEIDNLQDATATLFETISSYNVFKGEFLSTDGVISTSGTITTSYKGRIARCEVEPNTYYYIYRSTTSNSAGIRCLTESEARGKVYAPSNGAEYTNYQMPNADASNYAFVGQIKTRSDTKYLEFNCYFHATAEPSDDLWKKVMVTKVGTTYNPDYVVPEYQEYFEPYTVNAVDKLKEDVAEQQQAQEKKRLKILCIGNSFTQDSVSYVPFIIKSLLGDAVDLTIGIAYKGGALLVQHCAALTNQTQYIGSTAYSPSDVEYLYYKNVDGEPWTRASGNPSIQSIVTDEDWDIITLQQGSNQASLDYDVYYKPFLHKIEKCLFDIANKPFRLEWLSIQGTGATSANRLTNWELLTANSEKVMDVSGFDMISAFGTAVQNLRTISSLESLGDGGGLTYDGAHLQEGLGCLTAAYVHAIKWIECIGFGNMSIIGDKTRPTEAWVLEKQIPSPHWGDSHVVVGITENNCFLAQISAVCAVKSPYEVTDLNEYELQ